MPKPRSPNRDRAKEIYLESGGKIPLAEIARRLGVDSEGTVRGWKAKDFWDAELNGTFQSKNTERSDKNTERSKRSMRENRGLSGDKPLPHSAPAKKSGTNTQHPKARPGNKNAAGNRGGPGAPPANKRALTTGEHEAISYDNLTDDEKAMFNRPFDKYAAMEENVVFEQIRLQRMLKRMEDAESVRGGMAVDKVVKIKGVVRGEPQDSTQTEVEANINRVLKIESAVGNILAGHRRGVMNIHKMETDDARTELAVIREDTKIGSDDAENAETNFIDALERVAEEVWADAQLPDARLPDARLTDADSETSGEDSEQ